MIADPIGAPNRLIMRHWPEYLMEAAEIGLFLIVACVVVAWVEHPASPLRQALADPLARRAIIGLAMGLTAIAIIYSPLGKRSGAHLNPALTLTYLRLGKIEAIDAAGYMAAQFAGAAVGVVLAAKMLPEGVISNPVVNYVATVPGHYGAVAAFVAEAAMSFTLMLIVLYVSNTRRLNRYTALFAGGLVALYITLEAPVSGMSLNPARSFGSAAVAQIWGGLWIYFTAPVLGMLAAAEVYVRAMGAAAILCCKLHHENNLPCIFRCAYGSGANPRLPTSRSSGQ